MLAHTVNNADVHWVGEGNATGWLFAADIRNSSLVGKTSKTDSKQPGLGASRSQVQDHVVQKCSRVTSQGSH